jgi:hypothetical protein
VEALVIVLRHFPLRSSVAALGSQAPACLQWHKTSPVPPARCTKTQAGQLHKLPVNKIAVSFGLKMLCKIPDAVSFQQIN